MRTKVRTAKKLSTKRKKRFPAKMENKQGSQEFEMAYEHMQKFDPKMWESAIALKRQMSIFSPRGYEPDERTLEILRRSKNIGLFVGESNETVTLEPTKNPSQNGSFGFIGVFARALSNSTFIPGILILRFDHNKLGSVARETLRLFRWDENSQSFQKVFNSDVSNSEHDYVWGRITQPGIYAIIGLNSHPLVIRTAKIFSILSDLMSELDPETQNQLQERICKLLLHSPELCKAIEEPKVLKALIQGSAEQGFPDPMNAWKNKPNPGPGFDFPDFPDICPEKPHLLQKPKPQGRPPKPDRLQKFRLPEEELLFRGPKPDPPWVSVGPVDLSGQILQVIIDPVNTNRIYAVAASGGLWRLNDVSKYPIVSWVPLTDQEETLLTTSVAIAPSNNNVIYLANNLGHLLRSPDGGLTWPRRGTKELGYVRKIIVHPNYDELIFVASSTGFWRSLDGGKTWHSGIDGVTDLPLVVGDVTDAVMDPDIPSILYIGVRGSGLWKSYGIIDPTVRAWELMLPWPAVHIPKESIGSMIKIAVGRKGSDATRTIAVKFDQEVFINHRGGRPKSKPGGYDWKPVGEIKGDGQIADDGQGDSNHVIAIDPFHDSVRYLDTETLDETVIVAGAQNLFRSTNGGKSWNQVGGYAPDPPGGPAIGGVHSDQNSIMFDPKTEGRVYVCNDGGVYKSENGGKNWINLNKNLVTSQFWNVGVSGDTAVCGMYHMGIVGSKSLNKKQWEGLEGGSWEWSNIFGDPVRPGTFYVYWEKLWRYRFPSATHPKLEEIGSFKPTRDYPAFAVDPKLSSNTLLVGTQNPGSIRRTKNVHDTSPKWNPEPGINLVGDAIVSIAFAPSTPGMAYAVSVTGRVFRKVDVNSEDKWEEMGRWVVDARWRPDDVKPSPIPLLAPFHAIAGVRQIAVNALHDDHIYLITCDNDDATKNRIAFSKNSGKSWVEIPGTGEKSLPHCRYLSLLAHRYDGRTILLGVDAGVFISDDEGQNWYAYDTHLPNAEILEIFWSEDYLYASAHGRGLWRKPDSYLG